VPSRRQPGTRPRRPASWRAWIAAAAVLAATLFLGPLAPPSGAALADGVTITSFSKNPITADGADTTVVTAQVTLGGTPVDGETGVTFSSDDPNETISATTPVGGGSGDYQATITSSTSAGQAHITATDTTALPVPITSQAATLTQVAGPAASVSVTALPTSIPADGSTTSTVTAKVIDAFSNPVSGDPVVFSSNLAGTSFANASGTTDASGAYTTTVTGTKVGTATIKATDGGLSNATPLRLVAGPAALVSVSLSPAAIVANGISSTTATATATDANGNPISNDSVTFSSSDAGEVASGATAHANGTYTATIRSSTTVGTPTITATDSSVRPSVSGHATLTQTAAGSTVVLSASPAKAITNQPVTLVATVQTTSGPPAGAVTFAQGGSPISGCSALPVAVTGSIGTVTCTTAFAAASPPGALTAAFTPSGASSLAATSAPVSLTVGAASTTIAVSQPAATKIKTKVDYRASVTSSSSGAVALAGAVSFLDGGKPIKKCANLKLASGTVTCELTYGKPGAHVITVAYGGDGNFAASSSAAGTTTVGQPKKKKKKKNTKRKTVSSTMTWSFIHGSVYSEVLSMVVSNPPASGSIVVQCTGHAPKHGCPPGMTIRVPTHKTCTKGKCNAQATKSLDLSSDLKGRPLVVGAKLVILITAPGFNDKYYSFLIAKAGPQQFIGCLVPGKTTPNVGCTQPG
jgi:hypothetical protein